MTSTSGSLAAGEGDAAEALAERLAGEMGEGWRGGACPTAGEYLARHRELADHPRAALRLIYEEVCLRQEAGREMDPAEVVRRYPRWQAELELLFGCHLLLESRPAPRFPEAGELLGDFRLLAELGRGALGRVFLAAQTSLADRPVVLKVTPGTGGEHLTLAGLQHTHIIPINGAQDFPELGLRALCMPDLGGTTLARLLTALRDRAPRQRTGEDLLAALDRVQQESPVTRPAQGPFRRFLARSSYAQAVIGIGACLADALQYAHERGVLHLDLSPSNVLIAADGQPLLLDFHLARAPIRAEGPAPEWIGGTPAYMAPEQAAALEAVRGGRPVPAAVDARSDIYALGLLLHESLGGTVPLPDAMRPVRLSRSQPHVSAGLADILLRCLAPEPARRYPDAAALAADLRRHLADLPLKGVANRSLPERWRKLRRRQPHAPALAGMLVTVVAATLIVGAVLVGRIDRDRREARRALAEGREQFQARDYRQAASTLTRGLDLARRVPRAGPLVADLRRQLLLARRADVAAQLHAVARRVRFLPGLDGLSAESLRAVAAQCRALWTARDRFLVAGGETLGPSPERGIRADLAELVALCADLDVRLAPEPDRAPARRAALRTLAEARAALGPSPVLEYEGRALAEEPASVDGVRAEVPAPQTAWEYEALGRTLFRQGRLEPAAAEFDRALELHPEEFWPNFYRGLCAYGLGRYDEAEVAFRIAVALAPEAAECHYNLARTRQAQGRAESATHAYDRALRLDPTLAPAYLNRGLLHHQAGRHGRAIDDFRRALRLGADAATVHYNWALVELARGDRLAARSHLHAALRYDPRHPGASALRDRLEPRPEVDP